MYIPRLLVAALILLPLLGCGGDDRLRSADPAIRDLVDAVMAEYGGVEAMRGIEGYYAEGVIHTSRSQVPARTRRWFGRPDRLLLELAYPGHPEWRLTRGARGWTGPADGDWKAAGVPRIWPMRLQAVRCDLPLRLRERESELQMLKVDDRGRAVLRLDVDEGLHMEYHVDPETSRITAVRMVMDGPPSMIFEANYADFYRVDGVLFPHREETWARGVRTSSTTFETIVIDPPDLADRVAEPNPGPRDGLI